MTAHASSQPAKRRRPPYSKTFCPGQNDAARVVVGWPGVVPFPPNILVLPADESPAAFDWTALRNLHVFCQPVPGAMVPHDVLKALGVALVAAGVRSVVLFDGTEVKGQWWRDARERPVGNE